MDPRTLLAEKTESWLAAVPVRRSRRRFDPRPVDTETLENIEMVCREFTPWPDARTVLVRGCNTDVFTGIVGSYGKITGADNALLFIADAKSQPAQHHLGYTGEAAILHACSLGVDTCWIAGAFSSTVAAGLTRLAPGEKVFAISPIGHATPLGMTDHSMRALARSSSRKPAEKIAPGIGDSWPAWSRSAVEAARLAPSAMNRQPWRFRMEEGSLVIARDQRAEVPKVTRALDCGIAMLHAQLAASDAGAPGVWEDVIGKGLDVARYRLEG